MTLALFQETFLAKIEIFRIISHIQACMFMCIIVQEEQIQKVRVQNTTKLQQLDNAIQEKLEQAQNRKIQREIEQKEKLRNHVSNSSDTFNTVLSSI